jgi:NAD(P)-dependent dehydrogenase (short-subunit alcohol dehydrogenase family)
MTSATPEPAPTAAEELRDLPVIVTGGSSGLGAAVAGRLLGAGALVTVLDRRPSAGGIPTVEVDLADGRATEEAVTRVAKEAGSLWAVVTCAGVDVPGRLDEVDADLWERIVGVNLLGTAAVVRAALPHLRASGGRVVTVASTLGHRAVSDATAYCASKFGVVGFTRGLQAELKGEVGVTLLTPGGMHTKFFDERDDQYKPGADARLNRPEDVAMNVVHVLTQPPGCHVYELVVASMWEDSWPA